MDKETTTRVRGNFTQTAKGIAQLDVSTEAETVEIMLQLMDTATDGLIALLEEKGITVAHKYVEPPKKEKEGK